MQVQLKYNTTIADSVKAKPYKLLTGQEPAVPILAGGIIDPGLLATMVTLPPPALLVFPGD